MKSGGKPIEQLNWYSITNEGALVIGAIELTTIFDRRAVTHPISMRASTTGARL